MSKVVIAGDRNWSNFKVVENYINSLPVETTVIEGDCKGADKIAGYIASKRGMRVVKFPADWKLGYKAGPIRNRKMLDQSPEKLVIFHNDIENSRGSKNIRNQALKLGIPVEVITE